MQPDLSRIKVVSFDGDGTLWDFDAVMRHSLRCARAELVRARPGVKLTGLTINRMIEIRDATWAEMRGIGSKLLDVRREAFRRTLAELGIDDDQLADQLNAVYREHRFEDVALFPDVLPAMGRLQERYRLALLSNGNTYPKRVGLDNRFDVIVYAENIGVEKPDRRFFEHALALADCASHEVLHIGDSLRDDVAGANEAGMVSVWLNRLGQPNAHDVAPAIEVADLGALCNLL